MRTAKIILLLLICSGCGAGFHVKRAKYHLAKAEVLGASIEVKSDTIVKYKDVPFPVVKLDTVFSITKDTIRFTKDSIEYKILVRNNKIFVHAKSKPRYFRIKETVYINRSTNISAGYTKWQYISAIIGAVLFGMVTGGLGVKLLWR